MDLCSTKVSWVPMAPNKLQSLLIIGELLNSNSGECPIVQRQLAPVRRAAITTTQNTHKKGLRGRLLQPSIDFLNTQVPFTLLFRKMKAH